MAAFSSAGKPSPSPSPALSPSPSPAQTRGRAPSFYYASQSSIPYEGSLSRSSSCPINQSSDTDRGFFSCRSDYPDDDGDGDEQGKTMVAEDVFRIPPKEASLDSLRRWRKAALVLNATRRFRYTASLSREEDSLRRFRQSTIAVRAVNRFKKAGLTRGEDGATAREPVIFSPPAEGFGISLSTLSAIMKDSNIDLLKQLGGVAEIAKALHSDLENGICGAEEDIQRRAKVFGKNKFPRKPSKTLLWFIWEAFHDTTLVILIVCAVVSLIFGIRSHGFKEGWYDGTSIAIAVLLVVLITAISDYKQSLQFKDLNEEKENIRLNVQRGGKRCQVSIYDLVVGDIVPLSIGNQVPADGLFIRGHQMSIDESSLTGESDPLPVDQRHPYLHSGSKVAEGYGDMLVICVGMNTEWGQLMATLSAEVGDETPLQVRLNGVATFIGKLGLSVAFVVFVVLIVFYFTAHTSGSDNTKFKAGQTKVTAAVNNVVDIFSIAVTIIVVAVPEGLPLAVTLTLAYSLKKMMADKALVRRLSACETMGSATTICSDKTGTLTLNQMTVVKSWVAGELSETSDGSQLPDFIRHLLFEGIAFNTSGSVFVPPEGGDPEVSGSPTEKAVLLWGLKAGMDLVEVKSKGAALQVEVFDSNKKRAGVAVRILPSNGDGNEVRVHWKGAAEIVVDLCTKLLNSNGSEAPIDGKKKEELLNIINGMAASSLRCLAFAFKLISLEDMPEEGGEQMEVWQIPESELTLAAIVGIKDPCRPEVFDAVRRCQAAGVEVRMVTGDNLATAKAIAAECGIFKEGCEAIEGSVFRAMSEQEAMDRVPNICIMARSLPMDKLRLVKVLKALGHVVAVTGDGTNDAPALHEADVGLSMGIQGTEVAKENSDIVILDDNFASVVTVVRWGRSVYANIQKFIQFQLTVNVAALTINFVAAVSSGRVPLTAVQLLWVNLIMDTLGALALATEPPSEDLMKHRPVGRDSPLITNQMWLHIVSQASYQVAVLLTLQFRGNQILGLSGPRSDLVRDTIIFNAFVFCQIFNEVNARKPGKLNIFKGLFRNRLFLGIVCGTVVAQVLIVQFLRKFATTTGLDWQQWLLCVGVGFVSWPIAFVVKFLPLPAKPIISGHCKCCSFK